MDQREGLGIPLEFAIDPLTVVAQGAAIFAGTQRLDKNEQPTHVTADYVIDLEYKPVGIDREPLVGGRIKGEAGQSFERWTVEFINGNAQPPWRSGKIELARNGSFIATLWADKGRQNIFEIELLDPQGSKHSTSPAQIPFTVGVAVTGQSLIHSVGVAMADNKVDWFFEKGTPLPTPRIRKVHKTAHAVRRKQDGEAIRIPIIEGNESKADLNHRCGRIEIASSKLKRDVPAGSDVEITMEIDESRLLKAFAEIPILDESFEWGRKLITEAPDLDHINEEVLRIGRRLETLRTNAQNLGDARAEAALDEIEGAVPDMARKLENARVDRSVADECENDLRRFKAEVGNLEDTISLPVAIADARQMIEWTQDAVDALGTSDQKKRFGSLRQELMAALNHRPPDIDVVRRRTDEMNGLRLTLVQTQVEWWVGLFQYLQENKTSIQDKTTADQLLTQGLRAINANDVDQLKSACIQLSKLMPGEQSDLFRLYEGSTIR